MFSGSVNSWWLSWSFHLNLSKTCSEHVRLDFGSVQQNPTSYSCVSRVIVEYFSLRRLANIVGDVVTASSGYSICWMGLKLQTVTHCVKMWKHFLRFSFKKRKEEPSLYIIYIFSEYYYSKLLFSNIQALLLLVYWSVLHKNWSHSRAHTPKIKVQRSDFCEEVGSQHAITRSLKEK